MANPRKFSEKIALHTHRQAEETARFEQIMREVSDATARPPDLPDAQPPRPAENYRPGSRARSQGGPIRRPHDRRLDTSPYSSGPFLSPPPDTSWRRTNSDSALHQSTMQGINVDRSDHSNRGWMMPAVNGPDRNDGRPRSSCEVPPRVPGINIYPSAHEPGFMQIPISGNNTGSLPDLSTVDFSSPIHIPLDPDQDSSPYSSNHLSVPVNSRYLQQHRKNVPLDKNMVGLVDGSEYTQLGSMTNMYQQQQQCPSTSPSPTLQQAGYRSPRPSPQSSPSLGGRHSAPCSPGAPSPLQNEYLSFNQQQASFQQHFEHLSMMDPPVSSMSYVDQTPSGQMTQNHQQSMHNTTEVTSIGNIELSADAGYYSTSPSQQLVYPTPSPGLHTTPNTPTSIPDIILTECFGADFSTSDEVSRQLESEFFSEESLKEGLGSLDFDEIQMLSNSSINLPDSVEDHFRLDRS